MRMKRSTIDDHMMENVVREYKHCRMYTYTITVHVLYVHFIAIHTLYSCGRQASAYSLDYWFAFCKLIFLQKFTCTM